MVDNNSVLGRQSKQKEKIKDKQNKKYKIQDTKETDPNETDPNPARPER